MRVDACATNHRIPRPPTAVLHTKLLLEMAITSTLSKTPSPAAELDRTRQSISLPLQYHQNSSYAHLHHNRPNHHKVDDEVAKHGGSSHGDGAPGPEQKPTERQPAFDRPLPLASNLRARLEPEEDINRHAEDFIKSFRRQLEIERMESLENYYQMLARGV